MLVLENDLLLIRVVTRYSLDFGVRWNLELVASVTVEELSFLHQHLLDCLTDISIKLFNQAMFLLIFVHLFLDEAKGAIDNLLIELQLSFLLIEVFLRSLNLHRIEVKQLVLLLEHF